MIKSMFYLLGILLVSTANAAVYKCTGANGQQQFADKPCQNSAISETLPDRVPAQAQEREAALERATRMRDELAEKTAQQQAERAAREAEQARLAEDSAQKSAGRQQKEDDAQAVASCVRDVERRGAPQNEKAGLIAACQTARSAVDADAVALCVRNIERTGGSEREKARQIARCHGADVQPYLLDGRHKNRQ